MIRIHRDIVDEIVRHAERDAPLEACGYLASDGEAYVGVVPMRNADQSPEHFSFDPAEQFAAVKRAREKGWRLSAVYHSHPASPARLSAEDLRLANDPDAVYLVYSILEGKLKAFSVDRGKNAAEISIEVVR